MTRILLVLFIVAAVLCAYGQTQDFTVTPKDMTIVSQGGSTHVLRSVFIEGQGEYDISVSSLGWLTVYPLTITVVGSGPVELSASVSLKDLKPGAYDGMVYVTHKTTRVNKFVRIFLTVMPGASK